MISSILPGGFIVRFEAVKEDEKTKFVKFGKDWRREYESLRAISGSIMQWFANGAGFSRKFDLQKGVEILVNVGDEDFAAEGVRGLRPGVHAAGAGDATRGDAGGQLLRSVDAGGGGGRAPELGGDGGGAGSSRGDGSGPAVMCVCACGEWSSMCAHFAPPSSKLAPPGVRTRYP